MFSILILLYDFSFLYPHKLYHQNTDQLIAIRELKDEDDVTFKKKVMDLLASKGSPPDLPAYRLDQELMIHQLHQEPTSVVDMTRDDNSTQEDPHIQRQSKRIWKVLHRCRLCRINTMMMI